MANNPKINAIFLSLLLFINIITVIGKDTFKPKIDYDNSLTSVASSIAKYFDLEPMHKTLPYLDNLFKEKKPENVILLLCDGLGSRHLDKVLKEDDFLIKNRKQEIFSVFPPTTAASLNSIKTGLNPSEHGWLGWTAYVKPIDKIITLYRDYEKGSKTNDPDIDFLDIKDKYYYNKKTIVELINEAGKYLAYELNCYPYNVEKDIDKVFNKILDTLKIKGKKYIFSYYPEPDEILHQLGIEADLSKLEIEKINKKVEEYAPLILDNKKTVLIVLSDHGHLVSDKVDIRDKEISNYLAKPYIFIENRSPAFLVKEGMKDKFKEAFLKDFGDYFYLLSKEEVLEYNLYGEYAEGNKHELFESSFGDFIGIAKDTSNVVLLGQREIPNKVSFHGGYSDEEVYIPLIVLAN